MTQIVSIRKMLENGVHFGHQTRRWNPKMKPYIYTSRNGVYIVDLNQTQKQIEDAYNALKEISERGGKVLFVGTKKQAAETVEEQALRSGSFYVNKRWLGGLLTNFRTIQKRVKRLVEIEEMEASGKLEVYTKKEQARILKEKAKLEASLGGIKEETAGCHDRDRSQRRAQCRGRSQETGHSCICDAGYQLRSRRCHLSHCIQR